MAAGSAIDELVALVNVDPRRALAAAERLAVDESAPAGVVAELRWVAALAHRALGHVASARLDLEEAQRLANDAGDPVLAARVTISLAFEVGHAGDIPAAMALLAAVEDQVDPRDRARFANQRGIFHYRRGELDAALSDLEAARRAAAALGDGVMELRALANLGAIQSQRAAHEPAKRSLADAIELAERLDQPALGALAYANLAYVATLEGDLPRALDAFAAAEERYARAGSLDELPRLHADHALALADAHLLGDAAESIERALALAEPMGNDLELAELLLTSAEIHLARDAAADARRAAADAEVRFARQGRESWLEVAARVRLHAEALLVPDDPAVAEQLVANGRALAAHGWRSDAVAAVLLAALLHAEARRDDEARQLVGAVGAEAAVGRMGDRILLARVLAQLREHAGDRASARRIVTAGLRVAATAQASLGSLETRSHAARHGAALIELGARLAVGDGRPRELLERIEAMRTMVWHAPLVRPPDDDALVAGLAELRRLSAIAADPDVTVDGRRAAERERLRVERSVRGLARRARADGSARPPTTRLAVAEAIGDLVGLGDRQLLAYANLHGELLAVSVDRGRCRLHELGPAAAVDDHVEAASFALHRLNRAQGSDAARAAAAVMLDEASDALGALLVPRAVARSDRPLVIVPTGALHGVPWTALGVLAGRAVSVSPSLSAWSLAARRAAATPGGMRPVGFAAGPGLPFAEPEVRTLARTWRRRRVIAGPAATAAACLGLFASCELVHLACHGTFRRDNPMFSTLAMADGSVTVYDLERASRMPEVVVLSACSVGASTAITGGTLLGLSSALGTFGASDVVAPLSPVNDERVVTVMQHVHAGLAAGATPAEALAAAARPGGRVDPVAALFVVLGA